MTKKRTGLRGHTPPPYLLAYEYHPRRARRRGRQARRLRGGEVREAARGPDAYTARQPLPLRALRQAQPPAGAALLYVRTYVLYSTYLPTCLPAYLPIFLLAT